MNQLSQTTQLLEDTEEPWVFPSMENLEYEWVYEYKKHIAPQMPIFASFQEFVKSCQEGQRVEVTPEMDQKISNRSQTENRQQLLSLISTYSSFGTRRSQETMDNLYNRIQNGQSLNMPIVLVNAETGRMLVMSGNTRMDVAFQLGMNPVVLMVRYS